MSDVGAIGIAVARVPRKWWALAFLVTGNVIVFTAVTMMNVAIPQAQSALGFADSTRASVVTVYSLCFGTFMLLAGRLADTLGLRRCLSFGLAGFALASALGEFAPTVHVLLISRAAQGMTGALVVASALAMVSVMFPEGRERVRAFGLYGMAMGMGVAASFSLAGALVSGVSWRWVMLIDTPIALAVMLGVIGFAPAPEARRNSRLRLESAVLITIALGLLVVGLDQAGSRGWSHGPTLILLGISALLIIGFIVQLRRSRDPLIPLFLLGNRRRLSAFCAVLLIGLGVFAGMFILTALLQSTLGYTPLLTGAAFLPWGLSAIAAAQVLGSMTMRLSFDMTLAVGMLMVGVAMATLSLLRPDTIYVTGILPAMLLFGAGSTIVMVAGTSAATLNAGHHSGIASALVNASQQIGAAVGTALLAAIITATVRSAPEHSHVATLTGYATASGVGAILICLGAIGVIALARIRLRSPGSGDPT